MTNLFFLLWGLVPVTIGFGFIFRPRRMAKAQVRFRQRMERMEKRFFKANRATGLAFVLLGTIFLLTYFHPVWIYNMFVVARLLAGLFFPELFETTVVEVVPTTWI